MSTIIVIFANSVKHGKHCVAGKVVNTHQWIRPVSDIYGAELTDTQCLYENPHGQFKVKPLQIIEMNLAQHVPLISQPENHLISDQIWQQRYRIDDAEIIDYLDIPETLWGAGNRVNYAKIEAKIVNIDHSLYLVKVSDLQLSKTAEGKRRAIFNYAGIAYDLPVTDPNFEKQLADPQHQQMLCVSLGEKHDPACGENYSCYKIVATIL
ncbi:MAG TPA: hypothetical protein ENG90_02285 [Gammaproteobacteria bacterium]|nr:hypothetical protein [Gammaproteobacteria bacterium]HDZ79268.1 hypothetical protein [Gammaproteobacteria bacterium]